MKPEKKLFRVETTAESDVSIAGICALLQLTVRSNGAYIRQA